MAVSNRTKSFKVKYRIMKVFSTLCTLVPLIVYVIIGFISGDVHKGQKLFLGFTLVTALILTVLNVLMKYKLRSPIFIILLGIYYAMSNTLPLFVIISIAVVFDEFIFTPLCKKYKQQYTINKEIDARGIQ